MIHRISKSYSQASLRGELTAHLNGEKEVADAEDSKTKPIYQAELLGRSSSRSLALDAPTQSHYVKTRGERFLSHSGPERHEIMQTSSRGNCSGFSSARNFPFSTFPTKRKTQRRRGVRVACSASVRPRTFLFFYPWRFFIFLWKQWRQRIVDKTIAKIYGGGKL